MTVKTTTDPKVSSGSPDAAKHSCCGGEAAAESQTETSKAPGPAHHEHSAPAKAAKSSCGCGPKSSGATT